MFDKKITSFTYHYSKHFDKPDYYKDRKFIGWGYTEKWKQVAPNKWFVIMQSHVYRQDVDGVFYLGYTDENYQSFDFNNVVDDGGSYLSVEWGFSENVKEFMLYGNSFEIVDKDFIKRVNRAFHENVSAGREKDPVCIYGDPLFDRQ